MLKSHSGCLLPLLYSDASHTFAKEMAILKFPSIIMSVVKSMRLPLVKYYCTVVSSRVLGPLLHILFYRFLLSSFSLSLVYSIPFYSLHPCSERWLILPYCTVLGTTFIYSKSNTEILGTLSLFETISEETEISHCGARGVYICCGGEKRVSQKLDIVSTF